ncbi:hypothetical protein Tco_0009704 [Tanacetum coccineum]
MITGRFPQRLMEIEDLDCYLDNDLELFLCINSSSRSPENSHTIIESLPTSTTLIEDSDSNREEIDIFSGPDDSIPPGIESDFDSEEDIIENLHNDDPTHERLTFDRELDVPVINNVDELNEDECFDPGGGEINVEVCRLPYITSLHYLLLEYKKKGEGKWKKFRERNKREKWLNYLQNGNYK